MWKNITPAIPVELIIPSSLMDTSTTTYNQRIGNNSFNTCKLFTTLTFKDNPNTTLAASSRTSINENAFINCANLSVINWGNWVNELGKNCFSNCSKLTYLYIPISINIVNDSISKNSKLTIYYEGTKASYTLNGTPESQGDTYNGAPFPSEKNGVYYNVGDVSNIKLETTQKYYYVFDNSTVKEDAKEPGGDHITISGYVKTNAYLGLTANSATMKIAESHLINGTSYAVTEIAQAAFAGDGYTTRFDLPNNVSMIGLSGFYGCNNTTQIIGYTGSTYNNEYVFPTGLTYISNNGLIKTKLTYVVLPTTIDIYFKDVYYFANSTPNANPEARLNVFSTITDCLGFSLGTAHNTAEMVGTNMTSYDGCFYINSSRNVNNVCVFYS